MIEMVSSSSRRPASPWASRLAAAALALFLAGLGGPAWAQAASDAKPIDASSEKCLSCHGDGDSKALAAKTAGVKPVNPHETRHYGTEADCGLCHRQHENSVNFCLDCHPRFQFKVK